MEKLKCLIIGSGPAGYTAAIYAARAGMKPVVYAGPEPGGQLMLTTEVENFPGYAEGVQGPQMMEDFKKQAEKVGTEVRHEVITKVDLSGKKHTAVTEMGHEIEADSVIIATGASAKWLGLESEKRLMNKGVSACAVCDGFFFRKQDVILVGAGDTACEEATYLSKIVNKVYMVVRRDEMRASKIMQQRVNDTKNIEVLWNSEIKEIVGEEYVEGVKLLNNKSGEVSDLNVTAVFVAIGHKPNTDLFRSYIELDDQGYIVTDKISTKTNIEGVFACGDVQDKIYRQAVTAAGTGCMAALDAERYLGEKGL
jgi:thioredoxin reductase (NADPH)